MGPFAMRSRNPVDTIGKPWCLRGDKNGSYACMEDGQHVCHKWKPATLWTFLCPINGFPLTRNTMSSFSLRSHSKGLREKNLIGSIWSIRESLKVKAGLLVPPLMSHRWETGELSVLKKMGILLSRR